MAKTPKHKKQKQYRNKFNKNFKEMVQIKKKNLEKKKKFKQAIEKRSK